MDDDTFLINLDVQHFSPDEINVKLVEDNVVTVEGWHPEKQDEHGTITRHFVRKVIIPPRHNLDKIESRLSSDGVLTITAPRITAGTRSIPIKQTGIPLKSVYKEVKTKQEG